MLKIARTLICFTLLTGSLTYTQKTVQEMSIKKLQNEYAWSTGGTSLFASLTIGTLRSRFPIKVALPLAIICGTFTKAFNNVRSEEDAELVRRLRESHQPPKDLK